MIYDRYSLFSLTRSSSLRLPFFPFLPINCAIKLMEFLGTRQESKDEEDGSKNSNRNTRKGLPVHLQEVRDERGRQRLHGAFQGGFSAGYYNTVGSKEGILPS